MQLISAFVFAIWIVQSLDFLNPKFHTSSHLLWLYRPVCVGPGRKPRKPVFSQRGSYYSAFFLSARRALFYYQRLLKHLPNALIKRITSSDTTNKILIFTHRKNTYRILLINYIKEKTISKDWNGITEITSKLYSLQIIFSFLVKLSSRLSVRREPHPHQTNKEAGRSEDSNLCTHLLRT